MTTIQLKPVTKETIDSCLSLSVLEQQQSFVAPVAKSLAYAYVNHEYCRPFGIYDGQELVGYVSTIYDPSDGMYCIWHMLIDKKQQGKGYGTAALAQVITYFQTAPFGKGTRIGLSCHEQNTTALDVYRKLGFKETGEKDDEGEVILIRSLKTEIEN
ncbi:GNAT family N-acetyltransferase [uncultured Enterococcus sp.]|uniref:GNAT family N-acetyltransferase n=1 Tax=uncultured Enterococcus sp. TaxID=167972 RepID=UPI002AA91D7E|nr:GNAT family N-acetyltransferase [uncultured Enterococcus sp.]